jgi:hypothetical protein
VTTIKRTGIELEGTGWRVSIEQEPKGWRADVRLALDPEIVKANDGRQLTYAVNLTALHGRDEPVKALRAMLAALRDRLNVALREEWPEVPP